jgi:hypothetical protein
MTLDEIRAQITASTASGWQPLSGPVYLPTFVQVSHGENVWLEHNSHHSRAVLRDDVAIGLAWGLTVNESFEEDWSSRFPDPKASSDWLEVLYNGQPVDRELIVHVDGRCYVPMPEQVFDDVHADRPQVVGLRITQWQQHVVGIAQALGGAGYDYGDYVRRCGFQVVE